MYALTLLSFKVRTSTLPSQHHMRNRYKIAHCRLRQHAECKHKTLSFLPCYVYFFYGAAVPLICTSKTQIQQSILTRFRIEVGSCVGFMCSLKIWQCDWMVSYVEWLVTITCVGLVPSTPQICEACNASNKLLILTGGLDSFQGLGRVRARKIQGCMISSRPWCQPCHFLSHCHQMQASVTDPRDQLDVSCRCLQTTWPSVSGCMILLDALVAHSHNSCTLYYWKHQLFFFLSFTWYSIHMHEVNLQGIVVLQDFLQVLGQSTMWFR